ncbi:hypothetical protein C6503_16415 [Candidatus Poribacteria bacterium]|nr:MAG: hypothetical protein C6503_16415 [Candidatus Poribacteria bacterium]
MKALLKSLTFGIIFILTVGFGIGAYILQAPPVEQTKVPKFQIHARTAVRGRPVVTSKPLAYTIDVYRFNLDRQYISNLSSGKLERELLFSAALTHRARLKGAALDDALAREIDWQKMFANMTENIRFGPSKPVLEVLVSGEEWLLRNAPGAGYTVSRTRNQIDIYLPDLKDAFDTNKIKLSTELEASTQQTNKQWFIKDKKHGQTYRITNGKENLIVYQQSKYEILTLLFEVDLASQASLAEGKLSQELIQGFKAAKIPLAGRAAVSTIEAAVSWRVTDLSLIYNIRSEDDRLKVYLDLESRWLRIRADDNVKGWVQRDRGTIFEPPPPIPSSRQLAKKRLLVLIETLKRKVGISNEENKTQDTASR